MPDEIIINEVIESVNIIINETTEQVLIEINQGVQGIQGIQSSFNEIELLSGAIDGSNTIFVWASVPSQIYWGGQLLRLGVSYTQTGTTTTLTTAPFVGDSLWAYGNL